MMKSIFIVCGAAAILTGCCCNREYYNGNINYTQRGPDCVYTASQDGGEFVDNMRTTRTQSENKEIVYRNTSCATIYENDAKGLRTVEPKQSVSYVETNPVRSTARSEEYTYYVQTMPVARRHWVSVPVGY